MTEILARLFKLPFNLMASTMGAVALAMQTVRDTWSEEIDQLAPVSSPHAELRVWSEETPIIEPAQPPVTAQAKSKVAVPEPKTVPPVRDPESQRTDDTPTLKETRPMHDTDLSGKDELKLVRFKILFIKRDFEHVFWEREELIHEDIDGQAFASWKIAEFIQEIGRPPYGNIPQKWRNEDGSPKYPPPGYRTEDGDHFTGFKDEDKKHLRVYFEVLQRYPREEFRHGERQIEVLEEIRDRLATR